MQSLPRAPRPESFSGVRLCRLVKYKVLAFLQKVLYHVIRRTLAQGYDFIFIKQSLPRAPRPESFSGVRLCRLDHAAVGINSYGTAQSSAIKMPHAGAFLLLLAN